MAVLGREQFRASVSRYFELPGARFFRALGFTPNSVTFLGFGLAAAAACLVGFGWLFAGGIVFLACGLLDALDGALARLTGTANPFGALLDSVLDRLSEAALFLGLAIYALEAGFSDDRRLFFIVVLLLALIFSQAVSYLRARGEGLGVFIRSGLMTRSERVVLLGAGLLVDQIVWVLLFIAAASCFTLLQRLFTLRGKLNKGG